MKLSEKRLSEIKNALKETAVTFGFQEARVADIDTSGYFERFDKWVSAGLHGQMSYLERNQALRQYPERLHPGACRVVSLRYNYLPEQASFSQPLRQPDLANVSRYALGRDYHKLMRKKLKQLCESLQRQFALDDCIDFRVFVDSAPVLETSFAEKSGLGWKGKHSLVINQDAGSWFFLGEIMINLPLPLDPPVTDLCGNCNACIKLCPTDAIVDGKTVDATRCISYLTIENSGPIPLALRPKLGNRIYGCDDCQLACPWNRYADISEEQDFLPRNRLDKASLLSLWQWTQPEFEQKLSGSPIRRIGYQSWLRNLAVALGNGDYSEAVISALNEKKPVAEPMVVEHIDWAIKTLQSRQEQPVALSVKTQKLINCVTSMLPRDA